MSAVFISYDHDDQQSKRDFESIRLNPNNLIFFLDNSLNEPVYNNYGHVNRRMPRDSASKEIRSTIQAKLEQSSKLLVLIGKDTHSSEWVKWEIETFKKIKKKPNILFMRVKGNYLAGLPNNASEHTLENWNMSTLVNWIR